MGVMIRPIKKSDLEWARTLRNDNRKFFFDTREISQSRQKAWFHGLSYPFFVIEYNHERAGTIAVRKIPYGHELHNVLIDKKYQGKGLLKQSVATLEKTYGTPLFVDVREKNMKAIRAYTHIGFVPLAYRMQKK